MALEPTETTLIGIASVSAVLWTGGLIVLQLQGDGPDGQGRDAVSAAMALLAFGALAPLFVLTMSGCVLRSIAGIVGALYLWQTYPNTLVLVGTKPGERITALGYFAPTIAMLALVFIPDRTFTAYVSIGFDLFAYFILSTLARRQ